MREILFRGKDRDGKWHYSMTIASAAVTDGKISHIYFGSCPTCSIPAKTVGQYTGLTDKNGKKIFEGDIVRRYFANGHQDYYVDFEFGEFELVAIPQKGRVYICKVREAEVIGNIYDNPELLKGE